MISGPVLVFDLETIPDIAGARRLHDFSGLTDAEVVEALTTLRRIETGSEFLAHPLHRIVSIGVLYRAPAGEPLKLSALGRDGEDEADLLRRFFSILEKKTPTLISWNGGGFDLPVLHYRALVNGVAAPRYWELGENDPQFRFRNYISRFHWRHIDLMDVLSGYQARARTRLDTMATLLGLPGKLGMDGSRVWTAWEEGRKEAIHDYVEHDVLNTYLVYLRFEHMRGALSASELADCESQLRNYLHVEARPSLQEFLSAWDARSGAERS
jgi:predicted PolB exonuclease-like 3'-5' exonuclease